MPLGNYLLQFYRIQQEQKVRLIKAILITLLSLITLIFGVDSQWLNDHVQLASSAAGFRQWRFISGLSRVLATLLGLDIVGDGLKLALLAVILLLLIGITLMALFSGIFYVAGIVFLGSQLRLIFWNYSQGHDRLYRLPFSREPFLNRHWTTEEKEQLFQEQLDRLLASFKCPAEAINREELLAKALAQESREQLEQTVTEGFQRDYKNYYDQMANPPSSAEGMGTPEDALHGLSDFFFAHPFVTVTAVTLVALIVFYYFRGGGEEPPDDPVIRTIEILKKAAPAEVLLDEVLEIVEAPDETGVELPPVPITRQEILEYEAAHQIPDSSLNQTTELTPEKPTIDEAADQTTELTPEKPTIDEAAHQIPDPSLNQTTERMPEKARKTAPLSLWLQKPLVTLGVALISAAITWFL